MVHRSDDLMEIQARIVAMVARIATLDGMFGVQPLDELTTWREHENWGHLDTLRSIHRYVEGMLWQYEDGRQFEEWRAMQRI